MKTKKAKARCVASSIESYRGNRFIEALPDYISYNTRSIVETMSVTPPPIHPQASRRQRGAWLASLNHAFFVPLSRHVMLQETVDMMIREGYARRAPRGQEDWEYYQDCYERLQKGEEIASVSFDGESKANPMSAGLIGCSGVGKSYGLSRILDLYPQVITHEGNVRQIRTDQIVYLLVQCPHEGSVKSLCANIIAEIDKVTGEKYSEEIINKRPTLQMLKLRLVHLMAAHQVGLLIIDEIQNLATNKRSRTELFNFIVDLANSLSVPILYVGTPKVFDFIQEDLRIARRFGSAGVIQWDRLPKASVEWNSFVEALSKLTVLKSDASVMEQSAIDALYEYSQGIIDIVIKLFILSQLRCMVVGEEALSDEIIKQVFEEYFKNLAPMIKALQEGDAKAIDKYEDIRLPEAEFKNIISKLNDGIDQYLEQHDELKDQELSGLRKISNAYAQMGMAVPDDIKNKIEALQSNKSEKQEKSIKKKVSSKSGKVKKTDLGQINPESIPN